MIPNNNLSVLPWYASLQEQNARKWWVYGRVYPLYCPAGFILPFQIIVPHVTTPAAGQFKLYDANTNTMVANITTALQNTGLYLKQYPARGYDILVYPGQLPVLNLLNNGRYYLTGELNGNTLYSEVFTVVNDIQPYLKLTWWDVEDFVMDAGAIIYQNPTFKNVLYLQADLAKPEYPFEEEGESRDGYFFPVKMISEKRFRFSFLASEYLLDVLRFVRMADYISIEYHGQKYSLDTFLITPEWESNGDVATVQAEFETATVAKKIGLGFIKARRGDFNADFNNDFNNE